MPGLEDESLQSPLVAERIVGGVAQQIVHSGLPDAGLDSLDDCGHPAVKFPRHVHGQRVLFLRSRGRGHIVQYGPLT